MKNPQADTRLREWDKEAEYFRDVVPLVDAIYQKCSDLRLPLILMAQYAEKEKTSSVQVAQVIPANDLVLNHKLMLITAILRDDDVATQLYSMARMFSIFDHMDGGDHKGGDHGHSDE